MKMYNKCTRAVLKLLWLKLIHPKAWVEFEIKNEAIEETSVVRWMIEPSMISYEKQGIILIHTYRNND